MTPLGDLPAPVVRVLAELLERAPAALGDTLRSIVLFGSAAEGRLRSTSDINLAIVLDRFEAARIDPLRDLLIAGRAAVGLDVLWLMESEIPAAAEAFAVKFADISRRRRVLHGPDPFAQLSIPREAAIRRLQQVLLNLVIRLRARYALEGLHEERLALIAADAAGPLRASAAELIVLDGGTPPASPREALERVARELPGEGWSAVLDRLREARETRALAPGTAAPLVMRIMDLACHLHTRARHVK
jgi:hypothetical protein